MLCGHWCLGGQFVALLCGHWCLAPGGDLLLLPERLLLPPLGGSRGSGHQAGHKSGDCGLPLSNMVGIDLLLLPDDMVLEVHSTTGNVKDLSLPLADVVGNLSGMGNLGCPPSSSSGRARDQSGDIAGSDGEGGLPLSDVVGNLSCVGNLGCPPSSSSGRAGDQSGDIAGSDGEGGLPLTDVVGNLPC